MVVMRESNGDPLISQVDSRPLLQVLEMADELQACAMFGTLERVQQLVEGGTNVDYVDGGGSTAGMSRGQF
jgi:hypothetical protein